MYCMCGAKLDQVTGDRMFSTTTMDQYGEIIFAMCSHGKIIIDKTQSSVPSPVPLVHEGAKRMNSREFITCIIQLYWNGERVMPLDVASAMLDNYVTTVRAEAIKEAADEVELLYPSMVSNIVFRDRILGLIDKPRRVALSAKASSGSMGIVDLSGTISFNDGMDD